MSKQKTHKKDKYGAVIIGAGRIASAFDSPQDKQVLTHAHAYRRHSKTELLGFFDISKKATEEAAEKWGCQPYHDLSQMLEEAKPDLVSICTPDDIHFDNLITLAEYNPKIVICEKPVTTNISDTEKVVDLYKKKKIPALINYSRRFDKSVQTFKKELERGEYGKVISASGIYTKGILHNGSHMIDLCRFLFGEYKTGVNLHEICDYNKKDKTVAGFLSFANCPQFHLKVGDERQFSIFELDIILEKARFHFFDSGFFVSIQEVKDDPLFAGYKCLGDAEVKKTFLDNALVDLVNHAIEHLEQNKPLVCELEDALRTQKVCLSLLTN
ncbi:Gfo/Idh/MocA family oxidoreductase [Patescibacteria group bacterium]|nr:Gfo/Idh/MocA family oxidoreductase [Patescibacteria group bacterium]